MRLFILFITALFACLPLYSQPVEYDKIHDLIKDPDKLIKVESSTEGGKRVYVVTLEPVLPLDIIIDKIIRKTGLYLKNISFNKSSNNAVLTFDTSNLNSADLSGFVDVTRLQWKNTGGEDLIFKLSHEELSVKVSTAKPFDMQQNMLFAQSIGLKVADSASHKNYNSTLFIMQFEKSIENTPSVLDASSVFALSSALAQAFGNVQSNIDNSVTELTFTGKLEQIQDIFKILSQSKISLTYIFAACTEDKKVNFLIKVADTDNFAAYRQSSLEALAEPSNFAWILDTSPLITPVLTGFETDFTNEIRIFGKTNKSALIFPNLFPKIKESHILANPFFERGTYSDTPDGRMLDFIIKCSW